MKQAMLPYLRTAKLLKLRAQARMRCAFPHPERDRLPVRFIVGCGRSGTTILGRMLSANEHVHYLREPYHLWHAIDPRMDVTGLHSSPGRSHFFLGGADLTPGAGARYDKLIGRSGRSGVHRCVIEKTPHNAGKLGWIREAEPEARVVHIVRNGLSVVRSIDRLASRPTYKLGFKPNYNQWWGERGAKWDALRTEGPARGYFGEEVDMLVGNDQKGAYEWLVSIGEVDRRRDEFGDRLLEITYTQLTAELEPTCRRIAQHFDIPCPRSWIESSIELLSPERINEGEPLRLPPGMMARFNQLQQRYGFDGRAQLLEADRKTTISGSGDRSHT